MNSEWQLAAGDFEVVFAWLESSQGNESALKACFVQFKINCVLLKGTHNSLLVFIHLVVIIKMLIDTKFAGLQNEEEEEPIAEEDLMENARVTYDVFVQNSLEATSHTLEWLPYTH